ncbi:pathogenesis-related protein 1-like [Abrus precatorius]|uniref:Pathogenesis-related protein 1-like n=1 Tax=Abrus precatorius TaxID=3816 RepID=A0A8B8K6J1_ABRPR|nr:pathogenesis-related protein 1-like [Abrus precatorius]
MGLPNSMIPLMAILLGIVSLSQRSNAQNSPQDYLNAHNTARSQVGVGPMTWDATVASYAQNYVNTLKGSCKLVHSGGRYGENLAWSSGDLTGIAAVTTQTLVLVGSAATTHRWFGATQCVLGVPKCGATMVAAPSSAATMIHLETMLIRDLMISVLSKYH